MNARAKLSAPQAASITDTTTKKDALFMQERVYTAVGGDLRGAVSGGVRP
jgi:hypothetical protein